MERIIDGEDVIKEDSLRQLDKSELIIFNPASLEEALDSLDDNYINELYRDLLSEAIIMENSDNYYMLLGLENQTDLDYSMVIRCGLYDFIRYYNQVKEIEADYKLRHNTPVTIGKDIFDVNHIKPIKTIVLYLKPDPWIAPRRLHETFGRYSQRLLSILPDYELTILEPNSMSDNFINKFKTINKEVISFIKYSNNKHKLSELINGDSVFSNFDINAALLIKSCANIDYNFTERQEGGVNMCKAIEDLVKDGYDSGYDKARIESIRFMIEHGLSENSLLEKYSKEELELAKAN